MDLLEKLNTKPAVSSSPAVLHCDTDRGGAYGSSPIKSTEGNVSPLAVPRPTSGHSFSSVSCEKLPTTSLSASVSCEKAKKVTFDAASPRCSAHKPAKEW
eukprot:7520205-Prorocentrum_lima.AAC.1